MNEIEFATFTSVMLLSFDDLSLQIQINQKKLFCSPICRIIF